MNFQNFSLISEAETSGLVVRNIKGATNILQLMKNKK